ncbi:MAG TPA: hypothetical protein VFM46_18390, partial [Pseudomonadales bacterium]|nr:hypothetical protein [Pseudomonadales bacterium]
MQGIGSQWRQVVAALFMGWILIQSVNAADTAADAAASTSAATNAQNEIARLYAGIKAELLDFSEVSYNESPALAVTFSTPIDATKPFSKQLKVFSTDTQKRIDSEWLLAKNGLTAYFTAIEPSSHYRVEIDKALPFANSSTSLTENLTREVSTKALPPSLSFSGRGSVLPVDLSVGLPVTTVNVKDANVDFFRVNPDKLPE